MYGNQNNASNKTIGDMCDYFQLTANTMTIL